MKKTFLICSLPRSRTAWISNFLTYGPSFCFHEPFVNVVPQDMKYRFELMPHDYLGIADSLCTLFIEDLLKIFPESKIVVIRRPVEEVIRRFSEMGLHTGDFLLRMDGQLSAVQNQYDPLVIDYHKFNPGLIWEYLIPEVPLSKSRMHMLENFNITVPLETTLMKGFEFIKQQIAGR